MNSFHANNNSTKLSKEERWDQALKLVDERKLFVKVRPEHKEGSSLRSEFRLLFKGTEAQWHWSHLQPEERKYLAPIPPLTDWLRGHSAQWPVLFAHLSVEGSDKVSSSQRGSSLAGLRFSSPYHMSSSLLPWIHYKNDY